MSFIVMVGGGAATLYQQYGLPLYWGGLIFAALDCCTVIFGLDALVKVLGMIGPVVATAQIPNLVLANRILPDLTPVFAIIVFAAIYTTSVPLLWTASSRFATEKSMKFYIITIYLAALGYLIAMKIPFNRLLNLVYVINGYGGIILLGFIINKNVRLKMAGKKSKQTALHD